MSTTPIRCPYCGSLLRVAVQPSQITRTEAWPDGQQLLVKFDDQKVAHVCKEK